MTKIYVNLENGKLCDRYGVELYGYYPTLYYGSKPSWFIRFYTNTINKDAPDFGGAVSFRAAVDIDLNNQTTVLCRTLDAGIDKSDLDYGILTIPIDTLTTEFQTAASGQESRKAYFELWGYDTNAKPVFYHRFEIRISGVVDATGGSIPASVVIDYYTAAQVNALLDAGFSLQFVDDPDTGTPHTTQTATDEYYRFRNANLSSAEWSPWIALIHGTPGTGNNWFTGEGEPTYVASQHAIGDMYLDTENGDVYQVQTVSSVTDFVLVGNLTGPTGSAGLKGDKGDTGATGAKGDKGDDGEDGAAAGFGTPTATAQAAATAAVRVTASGPDTAKVFAFEFDLPNAQFTNGVTPFSFTSEDLTNNILVKTFSQLGIYGTNPIPVQVIDNSGVCRDADSQVSVSWTSTGINVDLSQISGGITGTWKLIFGGGSDSSVIGNINTILDSINGEVL